MKFRTYQLYLLISMAALIVCLFFPLVQFTYTDYSSVSMGNFSLVRSVGESNASPWALGGLAILSALLSLFVLLISFFQNFELQKRGAIFNCMLLAGYYIVFLIFFLLLDDDTLLIQPSWTACLPFVGLIAQVMTFFSIRRAEARVLAKATNFRLRD